MSALSSVFSISLWVSLLLSLTGCNGSNRVEAASSAPRSRMDQILSPSGSSPGDIYAKRSRYDRQNFRSSDSNSRPFASNARTYKGNTTFNSSAYQKNNPRSQRSQYQNQTSHMADDEARTFLSRYQGQEARTSDYGQGDKVYTTGESDVADQAFYTGRNRYYAPGQKELGPRQLSRSAVNTANVYPGSSTQTLNVEDVRRVLNKPSRTP